MSSAAVTIFCAVCGKPRTMPRAWLKKVKTPTCSRQCNGVLRGDRREIGGATTVGYFRARSLTEGGYVAWVLRLVEIGAEGEGRCADVVEISRPDGLVDIADLGLTLAEAKLVLAGVPRGMVAAHGRDHLIRRPGGRPFVGVFRGKDFPQHPVP